MDWIFRNIPLLVFLFVVISMVRAALRAKKLSEDQQAGGAEPDEQHRTREIQERIRRLAAERRGQTSAEEAAPPLLPPVESTAYEPPAPRVERAPAAPARPPILPPTDPFGGRQGRVERMLRDLERRAATKGKPTPFPPARTRDQEVAEIERQQELAERMRALEEERALTQRRAAQFATLRSAELNTANARRAAARAELLINIHDPQALRRAVLLKEVLGTPVGLR